jgi:anti-sigma-K factor RskA
MNTDQYTDLCELYALGALDAAERVEFEQHLAGGCRECRAGLEQAFELNEMILSATPITQPRPQLRSRVLAGFGRPVQERPRVAAWGWGLAAAAVLLLAFGAWFTEHSWRVANSDELARLREIQQILQAPSTKEVTFGPQPAEPHGSIFVNPKLGMILIASGMPEPPAGWTYESWVVPKDGAPIPIEAFRAPNGRGVSLVRSSLAASDLKAVAVSLEPLGTPVVKPTKLVFAAGIGS